MQWGNTLRKVKIVLNYQHFRVCSQHDCCWSQVVRALSFCLLSSKSRVISQKAWSLDGSENPLQVFAEANHAALITPHTHTNYCTNRHKNHQVEHFQLGSGGITLKTFLILLVCLKPAAQCVIFGRPKRKIAIVREMWRQRTTKTQCNERQSW